MKSFTETPVDASTSITVLQIRMLGTLDSSSRVRSELACPIWRSCKRATCGKYESIERMMQREYGQDFQAILTLSARGFDPLRDTKF